MRPSRLNTDSGVSIITSNFSVLAAILCDDSNASQASTSVDT